MSFNVQEALKNPANNTQKLQNTINTQHKAAQRDPQKIAQFINKNTIYNEE